MDVFMAQRAATGGATFAATGTGSMDVFMAQRAATGGATFAASRGTGLQAGSSGGGYYAQGQELKRPASNAAEEGRCAM